MAFLVPFECLSTKICCSSCSDKFGKRAASFSLVLLLLVVGCLLAKRSTPKEKFGSSALVSSIDCRKVSTEEELVAKLDGNFAAKCNCTRHVIYTRTCVYRDIHLDGSIGIR